MSGDALSSLYTILADVLMPMWPSIKGIVTGQSQTLGTSPGAALEAALPLIGLFSNCYANLLQDVLDDVDFYEKQKPLALKDVVDVVLLSKAIALRRMQYNSAAWPSTHTISSSSTASNSNQQIANDSILIEWDSTLNAINSLLSQLFRRKYVWILLLG